MMEDDDYDDDTGINSSSISVFELSSGTEGGNPSLLLTNLGANISIDKCIVKSV